MSTRTGDDAEREPPEETKAAGVAERVRRVDATPELVSTARLIRRLLPGEWGDDDAPTASSDRVQRIGRQLSELRPEQPSAVRELGLGVLEAWEALSEARQRKRGAADVAILFTDLVGFSDWALEAGDEAAVKLLRQVGAAEEEAISEHGGIVVKRLGDGSMAVFGQPDQAVRAAAESRRRLAGIEVAGHMPRQRAGVHLGRPRKVGKDYLGVDVNIAARVGDAAKVDEILVSGSMRELLDESDFEFGRRRKLRAAGTPDELVVLEVMPR